MGTHSRVHAGGVKAAHVPSLTSSAAGGFKLSSFLCFMASSSFFSCRASFRNSSLWSRETGFEKIIFRKMIKKSLNFPLAPAARDVHQIHHFKKYLECCSSSQNKNFELSRKFMASQNVMFTVNHAGI